MKRVFAGGKDKASFWTWIHPVRSCAFSNGVNAEKTGSVIRLHLRPASFLFFFILSIFIIFAPSVGYAFDLPVHYLTASNFAQAGTQTGGSLEKDVQQSLEQSRAVVITIQNKLQTGASISEEIAQLKTAAENIRINHMLLEERFKLREEKVKSLGTTALARHQAMAEGYQKALTEYLSIIDALPSDGTIPQSEIRNLQSLLEKLLPKKKRPIIGSLPYKHLNYPAVEPSTAPEITPAYRGGNKTVSPDDTKSTDLVNISKTVADLAQSLNWQPVAIYEYVKNTIETEWSWGCRKTPEETLRQKSGNSCEQAVLLASLLKAAGFPTRLVRANIEFFASDGRPIERVKNLIGIDDPLKIAEFFQKAGIPFKPIIAGGKIQNFEISHIYVESQIPYANYRGNVIDEHGKTWLGLDTSIKVKDYVYSDAKDLFDNSTISGKLSGIKDEYLGAIQTQTPLEYLQSRINSELAAQNSQLTYNDFLRTKTLTPEPMKFLPASLQFHLIKATNEYTEIPDELIHKVRFTASRQNAVGSIQDNLFDITLPLYKLSNQQIAITYEPETVEDQEIINSYGGLDNTPSYLVRLRPVLKLNGERIIVAQEGLPMGSEFDLAVELRDTGSGVAGSEPIEKITNTLIVGNLSVIGIVAGKAVSRQYAVDSIQETTTTQEKDAERLLYEAANHYIDRWNQAEDELASLLHLSITRPIPTVVTVGGVIDVTYLLDMPHGFTWKGVFVDADLRSVEIVDSRQQTVDGKKIFMQLSSLQGSILENRIFEDDFEIESISTAKLMTIVNSNQVPILTIDSSNVNTILSSLPFEQNIKDDIVNSVNQNLIVRIPDQELTYENWSGIAYLKENSETGESGWMLSGMIAGGMTALNKLQWIKQDFANTLSQPYTGSPNTNPLEAVKLARLSLTDYQSGTVGKDLDESFQVKAQDVEGKPVQNVPVTFKIIAGGCVFKTGSASVPEITVNTGPDGIARARLTLGKYTSDSPYYIQAAPYWIQAGINLVSVFAVSGVGAIYTDKPFEAYGLPGEVNQIIKVYGDSTDTEKVYSNPNTFSGTIHVTAADQYGNPISNKNVTFTIQPQKYLGTAPTGETKNAKVFGKIEDCPGVATLDCPNTYPKTGPNGETIQLEKTTDSSGTVAHVIPGNTDNTRYTIRATTRKGASSTGQPLYISADFTHYTWPMQRTGDRMTDPFLKLVSVYTVDDKGNLIDAGAPGSNFINPLTAVMTYTEEDHEVKSCGATCYYLKGKGTFKTSTITNGTVTFEPIQGSGSVNPTIQTQNTEGRYSTTLTLGSTPAINVVKATGTATVPVPVINTATGAETTTEKQLSATTAFEIWAVKATVEPNQLIFINKEGYPTADIQLQYKVEPAGYKYISQSLYLDFYEKDKTGIESWMGLIQAEAAGKLILSRGGARFNPENTYAGELVLNRGSKIEIKSTKTAISVAHLQVLSDDPNAGQVYEARYSDGTKPAKRYRVELASAAPIAACANLSGQITVINKDMQQVTPPAGVSTATSYGLTFTPSGNTCAGKLKNPLTGEQSDKFIFSNRALSDADIQTLKNIHTTALYGGLGNTARIQVSNTTTILPIEPIGVIVLGIDGVRQDVLYPAELDKVQESGKYRVNIGDLAGFRQIFTGYDQPAEKQTYIMLPEVTAIFPSITLASWASIFTGVQAGQTGILGNEFFDRATGKMITFSDGAFKMMSIFDRFPLGAGKKPGNGAADKALSSEIQTVYEAIKTIRPDAKSTVIMHNYSRGADRWLYQEWLINKLRFAWNGLVGDEQDIARLMDSSPTDDTTSYINSLSEAKERFPALLAIYFAGLDHWAHDEGMDTYVQFFKDNSDKGTEKIVKALKDADEFDNKIFIITADHGHTAMPTDLKYKDEDDAGNIQYKDAEISCKLKLDFVEPDFPDFVTSAQNAEKANNNLHIWELGEVMKEVGKFTGGNYGYRVLAPEPIAKLFRKDKPYGARTSLPEANVIAALNGPMAHIYVTNSAEISRVAEMFRLTMQGEYLSEAIKWFNVTEIGYKDLRSSIGKMNLKSSIDKILIRVSGNYCVFAGLNDDGSPKCAVTDPFATTEYVDAWMRINGMNHKDRSGDIVLIMKDTTAGNTTDRYTTGVACKSWHGSLNPSDSYVPLIVSYPGGNKYEMEKILQKDTLCKTDYSNCKGNWKLSDIVKEIISEQYK